MVWFGTCADIDARMTADLGVRAMQVLFDTFVEKAGDGYVLLTMDGEVFFASRAFASRLGLEPADLTGQSLQWLVAPHDRVAGVTWLHHLLDNPGRPLSFRGAFQHKDGFVVRLKATGVNHLENSVVNAIAVRFTDEGD